MSTGLATEEGTVLQNIAAKSRNPMLCSCLLQTEGFQ